MEPNPPSRRAAAEAMDQICKEKEKYQEKERHKDQRSNPHSQQAVVSKDCRHATNQNSKTGKELGLKTSKL